MERKQLTDVQAVILKMLLNTPDMYGLELIAQSDGFLKRGTIYVVLSRLEETGLIESSLRQPSLGDRGPARRVYRITASGRKALKRKELAIRRFASVFGQLSTE